MFDAILLASYGGPEKLNEIEPFLDRILTGKRIPSARRAAVAERYATRGGVSPLPGECRRFLKDLRAAFDDFQESGETPPKPRIYWGNLFAPPFFDDALGAAEADGVRSLLVFPTSAFGSPPSCRRYVDAVRAALQKRSENFRRTLRIAQVPPFFDWAPFRRAVADELLTALAWDELDGGGAFAENAEPPRRTILFSAHSIPIDDGTKSLYAEQLFAAAADVLRLILDAPGFGGAIPNEKRGGASQNSDALPLTRPIRFAESVEFSENGDVAPELRRRLRERSLDAAFGFQSRSGPPSARWLEPSVADVVRRLRAENPGNARIVVVPIGFFFENMETVFDLDDELRALCGELGVSYRRAACCGNGSGGRIARAVAELAGRDADDLPICGCAPGQCEFSCRRDAAERLGSGAPLEFGFEN